MHNRVIGVKGCFKIRITPAQVSNLHGGIKVTVNNGYATTLRKTYRG